MSQESETITTEDAGDAAKVVMIEQPDPETPAETLQRTLETLQKTKEWALAKAKSAEDRIAAAGGEPGEAMRKLLAEIRVTAGEPTPDAAEPEATS